MINSSEPLVSIVTPCYNGERFLGDFFDSILNQNYKNIEVFFINDGSTDRTEEIAIRYKEKFVANNMQFHYIKQKNRGQAVAINQALPLIRGKYFMWPDADDILLPNNISKKVEVLEKNTEIGLVMAQAVIIRETGEKTGKILKRDYSIKKDNLFLDFIFEKNIIFCPGIFMCRTEMFRKCVPDMQIYAGRGGQNWQILLPILYQYKYAYIDEVLYGYRIVSNSHSRQMLDAHEYINRYKMHQEILIHTIERIDMKNDQKKKLIDRVKVKYYRLNMILFYKAGERKKSREEFYKIMKARQLGIQDLKNIIKIACIRLHIGNF